MRNQHKVSHWPIQNVTVIATHLNYIQKCVKCTVRVLFAVRHFPNHKYFGMHRLTIDTKIIYTQRHSAIFLVAQFHDWVYKWFHDFMKPHVTNSTLSAKSKAFRNPHVLTYHREELCQLKLNFWSQQSQKYCNRRMNFQLAAVLLAFYVHPPTGRFHTRSLGHDASYRLGRLKCGRFGRFETCRKFYRFQPGNADE